MGAVMVRLHPPTTVLCVLAVGLAAITIGKPHEVHSDADPRCAVLRRYIDIIVLDDEALEGQKPIIVTQDQQASDASVGEFVNSPNAPYSTKTHPLLPLYLQLENQKDVRVDEACPLLLKGLKRFTWEKAANRAYPDHRNTDEYEVIYFAVSLPAISEDRRQAIFNVAFTYGSLDGIGLSVSMQKDASNRWGILSQERNWIS